jgi:hypothetical protein
MQAPRLYRALLRIASWIVPARSRSRFDFHERYAAELANWWWLVERGEPLQRDGVVLCRRAFADASAQRLDGKAVLHAIRSPLFVPAGIAAALLVIAAFSHGFAVTRSVIEVARDMRIRAVPSYDMRGDRVFVYVAPILLALTTGLALLALGCRSLRARGWRYWMFLALKVVASFIVLPLFWIEAGTASRAYIQSEGWRVVTGLLLAIAFVIAVGRAVIWCIADQRRRCPSCLRRLVLPVPVGSWASQFEPAATEMLCEEGHGALALSDGETNGEDRWTGLDESWKALFH